MQCLVPLFICVSVEYTDIIKIKAKCKNDEIIRISKNHENIMKPNTYNSEQITKP